MRTAMVAMLVASGTMITCQRWRSSSSSQHRTHKGAKTRQSGESGYVGEQEKPGASARPPGKTDSAPPTTGSAKGTSTGATGSGEKPR